MNGLRKENPKMRTIPASGYFYGAWNAVFTTGISDHLHVAAPVFFIKIDSEETTGIILQQRINTEDVPSAKVIFNGPFIIGAICCIGAIRAFFFWLQAYAGFPFVHSHRTIAGATCFALPAAGIYIRAALEQRKEQRDFFMHRTALCDGAIGRCIRRLFGNIRNNRQGRNAVRLQQRPELFVFCAQLVNDARQRFNRRHMHQPFGYGSWWCCG